MASLSLCHHTVEGGILQGSKSHSFFFIPAAASPVQAMSSPLWTEQLSLHCEPSSSLSCLLQLQEMGEVIFQKYASDHATVPQELPLVLRRKYKFFSLPSKALHDQVSLCQVYPTSTTPAL